MEKPSPYVSEWRPTNFVNGGFVRWKSSDACDRERPRRDAATRLRRHGRGVATMHQRNIRVAAAASPRFVEGPSTWHPRRRRDASKDYPRRGVAAMRRRTIPRGFRTARHASWSSTFRRGTPSQSSSPCNNLVQPSLPSRGGLGAANFTSYLKDRTSRGADRFR